MDPDIRNFSQIEKLIRENPKEADSQVFEWQQFLKANLESSPELLAIEAAEEFYQWVKNHPEKNIDPSIFVGKEIAETYYYLREQHEDFQMNEAGAIDQTKVPYDLAATPLLAAAFLQRPKIMEDDQNYQKIEERLKKEWLKKNNVKDFSSKEGVDYLYGSLDDHTKTSVRKEAEEVFRNNPKFKKRVERYDKEAKKIYKKQYNDPKWQEHEQRLQGEIQDRLELLEKNRDKNTETSRTEIEGSQKELSMRIGATRKEDFIQKNSGKANVYFKETEVGEEKRREEESTPNISPSNINRLIRQEPPAKSSPLGEIGKSVDGEMGQTEQAAQHGLSNAGKAGSRAAAQAGKIAAQAGRLAAQAASKGAMALLASPVGWIIIAVVVGIVIIVFLIVFLNGRSKSLPQSLTVRETNAETATTSAGIHPQAITPTPAEP